MVYCASGYQSSSSSYFLDSWGFDIYICFLRCRFVLLLLLLCLFLFFSFLCFDSWEWFLCWFCYLKYRYSLGFFFIVFFSSFFPILSILFYEFESGNETKFESYYYGYGFRY
ncbi:hypothetical protein DFH27DRAFT_135399 [Peziza echinospora]|nr:hypothetical protein DFH27DRAFT_135399 [Peziza echinospora]